jgi:HSP20 family protein
MAELNRLRGEINRLFERGNWPMVSPAGGDWLPSVDVHQDAEKMTVEAELPGFRREDINVSLQGDLLTISGERKSEPEAPSGQPYQTERFYGRFERAVTLPEEVDGDRASATYKDGVLCIYLPKTAQSKRKQIEVQPSL